MFDKFRDYLEIVEGKSFRSKAGNPSTVFDYPKRVQDIIDWENIFIYDLAENIDEVISKYDREGPLEWLGKRSNRAYLYSLKAFKRFLYTIDLKKENIEENNSRTREYKAKMPVKNKELKKEDDYIPDFILIYELLDVEYNEQNFYYISDDLISDLNKKDYIKLSKESKIAKILLKLNGQANFTVNGYAWTVIKVYKHFIS